MAKLVITETFVGTNGEIQELKDHLDQIVNNKVYEDKYGGTFKGVEVKVELDTPKETPLQAHLRKELDAYRTILNANAIAQAEKLIEEAASSTLTAEEVADLEEQAPTLLAGLENNGDDHWDYYDEEYDEDDDCDCDDEDDLDEEDTKDFSRSIVGIVIGF